MYVALHPQKAHRRQKSNGCENVLRSALQPKQNIEKNTWVLRSNLGRALPSIDSQNSQVSEIANRSWNYLVRPSHIFHNVPTRLLTVKTAPQALLQLSHVVAYSKIGLCRQPKTEAPAVFNFAKLLSHFRSRPTFTCRVNFRQGLHLLVTFTLPPLISVTVPCPQGTDIYLQSGPHCQDLVILSSGQLPPFKTLVHPLTHRHHEG